MLSRESAFLAQNVLFLAVAFITLWGTVFPIFSEAAQDAPVTVGQPLLQQDERPAAAGSRVPRGRRSSAAVATCQPGDPRSGPSIPDRRSRYHRYSAGGGGYTTAGGGGRLLDLRARRVGYPPRMGEGHTVAAPAGRGLPCGLLTPAVREPTTVRGVRRASRYRHAGRRCYRVVLLQRTEGHCHEPWGHGHPRPVPGSRIWVWRRRASPIGRRRSRPSSCLPVTRSWG